MIHNTDKDINYTVGKNIENARNTLNMKQWELAEKSELSRSSVAKIEGGSTVTTANLSKISNALGVPVFIFFLQAGDWKNIVNIFAAGFIQNEETERMIEKVELIPAEAIREIEVKSSSAVDKDNRDAFSETKGHVYDIFSIQPEEVGKNTIVNSSRSLDAVIGMAMKKIPHEPLLNGIIAHLISQ